jgi:ABC-type lipoprotein export system ATPase subunit
VSQILRLIVCDALTGSLDSDSGHAVMELLRALMVSPDRAVVIVTHDNRIFELTHSITYMEDGRMASTHPMRSQEVRCHARCHRQK